MVLLYADEASFYRQPTQASLWGRKGRCQPKLRSSSAENTTMKVVGALNAKDGAMHAFDVPQFTAGQVAECWLRAAKAYPKAEHIVIALDNWSVHFHPNAEKALQTDPRIELLRLPTYAPWLNAIEKAWRWTKQRVAHAHPWCDDFNEFRKQVNEELQNHAQGSPDLLKYVGLFNQ